MWPVGKFAVDPDEFGLYKLDEHIDNPDEYPYARDKDWDFDKGCDSERKNVKGEDVPAGCGRVNVSPQTKMKRYEHAGRVHVLQPHVSLHRYFDEALQYMSFEFRSMVFAGRSEALARLEKRNKDADLWKFEKLRHFGQALHTYGFELSGFLCS